MRIRWWRRGSNPRTSLACTEVCSSSEWASTSWSVSWQTATWRSPRSSGEYTPSSFSIAPRAAWRQLLAKCIATTPSRLPNSATKSPRGRRSLRRMRNSTSRKITRSIGKSRNWGRKISISPTRRLSSLKNIALRSRLSARRLVSDSSFRPELTKYMAYTVNWASNTISCSNSLALKWNSCAFRRINTSRWQESRSSSRKQGSNFAKSWSCWGKDPKEKANTSAKLGKKEWSWRTPSINWSLRWSKADQLYPSWETRLNNLKWREPTWWQCWNCGRSRPKRHIPSIRLLWRRTIGFTYSCQTNARSWKSMRKKRIASIPKSYRLYPKTHSTSANFKNCKRDMMLSRKTTKKLLKRLRLLLSKTRLKLRASRTTRPILRAASKT